MVHGGYPGNPDDSTPNNKLEICQVMTCDSNTKIQGYMLELYNKRAAVANRSKDNYAGSCHHMWTCLLQVHNTTFQQSSAQPIWLRFRRLGTRQREGSRKTSQKIIKDGLITHCLLARRQRLSFGIAYGNRRCYYSNDSWTKR